VLIEITERQLANRGFSLADREKWFVGFHPEWNGRTTELLGVYLTCQSDGHTSGQTELEAALTHVQGCNWCRSNLAVRKSGTT
jgi:hypothetical protein